MENNNVMRLVIIQLNADENKVAYVNGFADRIATTMKEHNPRVIVLPDCPCGPKYQRLQKETIPDGFTSQTLSKLAKQHEVYIVGGAIPEWSEVDDKIYMTCTVWNPEGHLIGKHRKMHLYRFSKDGKVIYDEAETLTPGNDFTTITIDGHKIGIGICFDIRFEEMARLYRNDGCEMLIYPVAYHWKVGHLRHELLGRSRAHDNQLFVVLPSPARDERASYKIYGYSMVIDPFGIVIKSAGEEEEILCVDIDFDLVKKAREHVPLSQIRRHDLYDTKMLSKL